MPASPLTLLLCPLQLLTSNLLTTLLLLSASPTLFPSTTTSTSLIQGVHAFSLSSGTIPPLLPIHTFTRQDQRELNQREDCRCHASTYTCCDGLSFCWEGCGKFEVAEVDVQGGGGKTDTTTAAASVSAEKDGVRDATRMGDELTGKTREKEKIVVEDAADVKPVTI